MPQCAIILPEEHFEPGATVLFVRLLPSHLEEARARVAAMLFCECQVGWFGKDKATVESIIGYQPAQPTSLRIYYIGLFTDPTVLYTVQVQTIH